MILTCSICNKGLGELSPDAPAWEVSAAQKAGQYDGYARLRAAPSSPVCFDCLGRERARAGGSGHSIRRWTLKHWPEGAMYFARAELFTIETMGRRAGQ